MADKNDRDSRADELFEILNEYRTSDENGNASSPAQDEKKPSSPDTGSPEKSGNAPEADIGGEELPAALADHLSDEGSDAKNPEPGVAPVVNPHFTESAAETPLPPEEKAEDENEGGKKKLGGIFARMSLLPKALIYIIIVLLAAAYLSYFIISVGNDVFALVTDSRTVTIEIDENATDDSVAKLLSDNGIIEYGWVYKLYMKYRSDDDTVYIPGIYEVNTDLNYSQIITLLTSKNKKREVLTLTIPEGYTVDQIIDLFVSKGLGTREGYVEAINNYPYKHEFVRLLDEAGYAETRKYRLEGYLYPDTYDFYNDTTEVYVINKMLNNFNSRFWADFNNENASGYSYRKMCEEEYSMTFDDIVVLASMVQGEGKTAEDFEYISYVFHNRLSHSDTFPMLESDATIQYILSEHESDSTQIDITIDNPYNTYKYAGLPPGAICNAGLDALTAAMFPTAPTTDSGKTINAYYFVSNNAGKTYYASGLSGHQSNVAQVEKDNAAIESGDYNG